MRFQCSIVFLIHSCLVVSSFSSHANKAVGSSSRFVRQGTSLSSSSSNTGADGVNGRNEVSTSPTSTLSQEEQSVMENLTVLLDRWVILRSEAKRLQVEKMLQQIQSSHPDLYPRALKLAQQGGFSKPEEARVEQAQERKEWEDYRQRAEEVGEWVGKGRELETQENEEPKSALSRRMADRRDVFMGEVDDRFTNDDSSNGDVSATNGLLNDKTKQKIQSAAPTSNRVERDRTEREALRQAEETLSKLVTEQGSSFTGENLGIGGLDDVLAQIKRRVWIPLAAPPQLLADLGISPVRGLLLYGKPGCGKTLMARTIGKLLSPCRPVTVVSGPELMDKFVGSSEANVRKIFDDPPPVYDYIRVKERDNGNALSKVALHVIIMDEFDAMARSRGGKAGDGEQGEAGVARDSVVNQILAKMDGVDPLPVPTLVIGMTNKRSLIDTALLRPGRFEVQIEVPPPATQEQRIDILKVHFETMMNAGRLSVKDAGYSVAPHTYTELLDKLASQCVDFSGASLAGVVRAGASHALERAVTTGEVLNCLVTYEDLQMAIQDVMASHGEADHSQPEDANEASTE